MHDLNTPATVTVNGRPITAKLPGATEEFLVSQGLLPRSGVVEHALARILKWR